MGQIYYYFVASLPTLFWDATPPFLAEEFLEKSRSYLNETDERLLEDLLDPGADGPGHFKNSLLETWQKFSHDLRNELAYARAVKAGKDPTRFLRGPLAGEFSLTEIVRQATGTDDPLSAEKVLDFYRWQYLEDLGRFHYFDFESLLVYGLKLQILERYQHIRSTQGQERLTQWTHSHPRGESGSIV